MIDRPPPKLWWQSVLAHPNMSFAQSCTEWRAYPRSGGWDTTIFILAASRRLWDGLRLVQ